MYGKIKAISLCKEVPPTPTPRPRPSNLWKALASGHTKGKGLTSGWRAQLQNAFAYIACVANVRKEIRARDHTRALHALLRAQIAPSPSPFNACHAAYCLQYKLSSVFRLTRPNSLF